MNEFIMLVTQAWQIIVAQKIDEIEGIRIRTAHPAFISEKPDKTGFNLVPVQYIEKEFTFSIAGLLGYGPIPKIWEAPYEEYLLTR